MKLFWLSIILAASAALTSCSSSNAAGVRSDGRPEVLRYCFASSSEEPEAAGKRAEVIRKYLERELHVKVDVIRTTQYGAVIEAFRSNKIDLASISPFSYVLATQKTPIEAIVMRGTPDGEPGDYTGVLAVPGNSPLHSIDDVIAHRKELTVSFVDPDSTSGFLVQAAFF